MIYYIIINTQHINKFFSESTCELLFQYYSTVYTFPNCILRPVSHLSYSIADGNNTISNLYFPFKGVLKICQ